MLRTAIDALDPPVVRWLVFPAREMFKGGSPVREALEAVLPVIANDRGIPVISGTNADFIFMGRNVPPLELVDALSFAITAEVHAFDNASIVETLGTQAQAVGSGRALAQGKPVYVSPITFKMRHNPYATAAAPPTPPGQLPSQVDPRQMSLFAACWTAASIKHVAEAGAAGITYFETTGWRGVMETAAGSPVPDKFVSIPGGVFPAYHVFADVGEFSGGQVIPSRSADRLAVDGLALRKDGKLRVLVANMTAEPQTVSRPRPAGPARRTRAGRRERRGRDAGAGSVPGCGRPAHGRSRRRADAGPAALRRGAVGRVTERMRRR